MLRNYLKERDDDGLYNPAHGPRQTTITYSASTHESVHSENHLMLRGGIFGSKINRGASKNNKRKMSRKGVLAVANKLQLEVNKKKHPSLRRESRAPSVWPEFLRGRSCVRELAPPVSELTPTP